MNADDFYNYNEDTRRKHTFNLFLDNANKSIIKKLFILKSKDKFDSHLMAIALSSAIVKKQDDLFKMVFDFAEKHNKEFEFGQMRALFNIALIKENLEAIDYLDNKFGIIKHDFSMVDLIDLTRDGLIKKAFCTNGWNDDNDSIIFDSLNEFYGNCFTYQLNQRKEKAINIILNRNSNINNGLIQNSFIEKMDEKKLKSINILINNGIFRNIIESSSHVNLYMNESSENIEFKNKVKSMINVINLKEKMENILDEKDNITVKNKL